MLCILACAPLHAQDNNPAAPQREFEVLKPQPVCGEPGPERITILTPGYEMIGPVVRSRGSLQFLKGIERISASQGEYNTATDTGVLRDVYFTTCTSLKPDYHITAQEATLLPNNRLNARRVAFYLGNTRVLYLPRIKMRVGGRNATSAVFPRIGYDRRDGVTLSQNFRLTDTTHSITHADLKFTTLHAIEGTLDSRYGVGGRLVHLPGRYLTYGSMRYRALEVPQPPAANCDPQLMRPSNFARLQPYGIFTLRQRTYTATNLGLVVYRQPEVGVTYIGPQLSVTRKKLDPRIELYPQVTASWGSYKEVPGLGRFTPRSQIAAQASLNAVWLGPNTSIQPIGTATYANYTNDRTFQTWGAGIDITHIGRDGAFYAARYLSRTSKGSTPFQFDAIDIAKEIDLASMSYRGKLAFGFAITYDAGRGELFDWAVQIGRRSDCLGTYLSWDQRFRRLSVDATLINL